MANLFFTGIKHSGKTSIARAIANSLMLSHADTDDLILDSLVSEDIRSFYKRVGDVAFHQKEEEVLKDYVLLNNDFSLSLGGGACENTDTLKFCKDNGILILITRPEELVLNKILENGIPPFLDSSDLKGSFHSLYKRRNGIYKEFCDIEIVLDEYYPFDVTIEIVLEKLKKEGVLHGK